MSFSLTRCYKKYLWFDYLCSTNNITDNKMCHFNANDIFFFVINIMMQALVITFIRCYSIIVMTILSSLFNTFTAQ